MTGFSHPPGADPQSYPYISQATFTTRNIVNQLPSISINHMPGPSPSGEAYDYVVNALYANHAAGTLLPILI